MAESDRRLSEEWGDLIDAGVVPDKGKGATAERIERDEKRVAPRYPSEERRVGRKISPTLSRALVRRLRAICKAEGYVDQGGEGTIASPVIEDLLWAAVEAYERGEFGQEKEVVTVRQRLRRRPENG